MAVNPIDGTLAAEFLSGSRGADLIYGAAPALVAAGAPGLVPVATGLGTAVFATAAPGDAGRLFVVEKAGVITSLDLAGGTISPVLDISAEVNRAGEQGLLGLAFHPEFHLNGRLFLFFSNLAGDTVLREYAMDPADRGRVLPGSGRDLLTVAQPGDFQNHKAGWIGFGPDDMLHVATGDGGGGGDPLGTGQDPNDLLGSILRIDVDAPDAFPADPTRNYAIPADNPFAAGGGAPEVWAYGLRNPYRDGFDRGTGLLWIGDVGQGRREEIDIGAPGANYGWALYEGDLTYPGGLPAGALPPGITGPAFAYGREAGDRTVIGGYVHRGPDSALHGQYVFGDYVSGRVWTLADHDGDGVLEAAERAVLDDTTFGGFRLASFAEDAEGTLYALGLDGSLFRIAPGTPTGTPDGADTIAAGSGDDRVFAGAGNDLANGGAGDDLLSGMEGDDSLVGSLGADTLAGGAGSDLLRGGDGNDLLMGGAGPDRLFGDAGDDLLVGGGGGDRLTGGDGADVFRWTGIADSPGGIEADRVLDFDAAEGDVLDVSALVAGVFTMIGAAPFAGTGAQLRTVVNAAGTRVELSLDGGPADLVFVVLGAPGLSGADFLS
jgi:Ca2+-binding RTX toxin-like protein